MTKTIETEHVVIRSIAVSDMANNVYLITAKESGAQVLIDAADDADAITALIASGGDDTSAEPILEAIITTHQHWDHIRALPATSAAFPDAMTIAGSADAEAITSAEGVEIARSVDHLDVGDFGGFVLQAIGLRGHTPGSIALLLRDGGETILFSGDSLFPGGPGKTWKPEDFTSLMDDLEERVFDQLPNETRVLPGHGDATTLGAERPKLSEWRERGW
ncbi:MULTISPECIES: MBL fold metallo-hydrolase [Brevibacterium]|uniref:Glyoxylase, beta-lactamase superfamily II n=1 Tax=Brevibacterium aurantiacum TaxID=273384 RepID=A0A2H1JCA9_BREAU|nr:MULTISPECIES: MBL fold metallo-hydrolase [Brevibacterium]MDN5551255.1 MBL fold metallo-hydrolase [Brevibacterium sp.]AZL05590.1 MBL fold metallo-hydrolase [Brevibacterium aurantiacum]AZT93271.1 MBL fold metallo-hydrolase [Brevibacterium aurantiacum]AZT97069.1 MBL fold metallo-hydrolase [Brevibacterium aurantiacum]PCC19732.1 MBL fold metallo-hydrolase [Brevibacterium aurantiacum]